MRKVSRVSSDFSVRWLLCPHQDANSFKEAFEDAQRRNATLLSGSPAPAESEESKPEKSEESTEEPKEEEKEGEGEAEEKKEDTSAISGESKADA